MNITNLISEILETIFWVKIKILNFFDADLDPGSGIFMTLDPGTGMVIRIQDKHLRSAKLDATLLR
jgi:hypothetical protein